MVRASHPEPAVAVTTVATLLTLLAGARGGTVAAVAAAVFASQLATGWSNDAIDARRDAAVGRPDKPIPAGLVSRRTVAVAAGLATAATVAAALPLGVAVAALAAAGLASALLYNWPLKLTPLSVLPYAVSFALLPTFAVRAADAVPPWWLPLAGGLLGAGAHFANVLPDLADDVATGVRGLPHRLGRRLATALAAALLVAATAVLALGPTGPPSWAGLAALALAVVVPPLGWYAGPKGPFRAVMVVAVLDVVLLLLAGAEVAA
jgi:4-hydroxybenzoate polyprenyltransferase